MLIRAIRDGDTIALTSDAWSEIDPETVSVTLRRSKHGSAKVEVLINVPPQIKAIHQRAGANNGGSDHE